jgi:lipoic acid synthetase
VDRWVEPAEFDRYRDRGLEMGFSYVASGPLVRSSYRAAEAFLKGILTGEEAHFEDRYGKKKTRLRVVT